MHSYLRAIGFSKCKTSKEVKKIIKYAIQSGETRHVTEDEEAVFGLVEKNFSNSLKLYVFGEYDEEDEFCDEYYYPVLEGQGITSYDIQNVEKHNSRESYIGVSEDLRVGVSIIFYIQNIIDVKNDINSVVPKNYINGVILSGLSDNGKILFPLANKEKNYSGRKEKSNKRMDLIAAARNGDEDAIESLTIEDIDTYSMVSRRIVNEDIFSIVETYFMPYGVECDMYAVLGDIVDYRIETNSYTQEQVYIITISCNDLIFDVCINKEDLLGEPAIGRRFKGNIWLQGKINFSQI